MQVKLIEEVDARLENLARSDGTDKVQRLRDLKRLHRVIERLKEADREAAAIRNAVSQPIANEIAAEVPSLSAAESAKEPAESTGHAAESAKEPAESAGHAAEPAEHVARSAEQGGEGESATSPTTPPEVSIVPTALRPENFPKVGACRASCWVGAARSGWVEVSYQSVWTTGYCLQWVGTARWVGNAH